MRLEGSPDESPLLSFEHISYIIYWPANNMHAHEPRCRNFMILHPLSNHHPLRTVVRWSVILRYHLAFINN
jgi:hypothetical protein